MNSNLKNGEVILTHKGTVPLETDRLILRKLTREDSRKVFENWTCDSEVSKFMRWDTHASVDVTGEWLKECEKAAAEPTFYDWGIILKEINEPIGSIGAFVNDEKINRYEVGYALSRKYWNRGITTEALKCMMDFLVNEVGVKHFIAKHAVENPASGAVMKHVGFAYSKNGRYASFSGLREFECCEYILDLV